MNKKTKILYIDDEPFNCMLFKETFNDEYAVYTAHSGNEGLKILSEIKEIHIVISDMRMPIMNGLEFITMAKQEFPEKKYFILTGNEISQEMRQAIQNKLIIKYFQKPLDSHNIKKAINATI